MALSISGIVASPGGFHCIQTDATSTVDTLKAGAGSIFKVEIDNTNNSVPVFLKLWDTVGGFTVGGTHVNDDPDFSFQVTCVCASGLCMSQRRNLCSRH